MVLVPHDDPKPSRKIGRLLLAEGLFSETGNFTPRSTAWGTSIERQIHGLPAACKSLGESLANTLVDIL